ncbi:MAG: hypothetical protein CL874_03020 [Dehalococcoidales bacterium]|jgi:hypothetical protein|nr:hypothetical protein [Dehalococcoidales bacterium]
MKIKTSSKSSGARLTEWLAIVPFLFAIVLGSSLIEFYETLFSSKITSLNFWALLVVYLATFSSWFGWYEAAYRYPYTCNPLKWIEVPESRKRCYLAHVLATFCTPRVHYR